MKYKTRGIVFNFIKFRESSIIARIYTDEFGLKNYIVNNVRAVKPRYPVAYFQPMTLLEMIVYNKKDADINRLSEIKCSYAYKSIPYNVTKSSVALFLTEMLHKTLREEEANPELFDFVENALRYYDACEKNYTNFHLQFLFRYARYQGIEPLHISGLLREMESVNYSTSIKPKDFEKINQLIQGQYSEHITLSNTLRRELLTILILFYRIHFENIGDLKSYKVLMEVFRD